MTSVFRTIAAAIWLIAVAIVDARDPLDTTGLRLNQLPTIGSHNSYKRAIDTQASGAQVISTDYPLPDERLGTGYSVAFEGGGCSRRNPVTAPETPASVEAAPSP